MSSDRRNYYGCEQKKKQRALAVLYLESGRLQNAANASVVPTEFAAEPTTKMKSSKKKFRNLNFSPSTIYRYLIFFLKFKTSTLSNNRFAACTGCPKALRDFPPRKDDILLPRDYPHPPPESVRTDGRTLKSKPNFLASIG